MVIPAPSGALFVVFQPNILNQTKKKNLRKYLTNIPSNIVLSRIVSAFLTIKITRPQELNKAEWCYYSTNSISRAERFGTFLVQLRQCCLCLLSLNCVIGLGQRLRKYN